MTENTENTEDPANAEQDAEQGDRPRLWLVDAEQGHLAACMSAFAPWADCEVFAWNARAPDWENPPHAVFFSAEIPGGANAPFFAEIVEAAGAIPLIAVARLRSLAQAVAYFRAGAADYLSLPLEEEDARERFAAALDRAARLAVQNMVIDVEEAPAEPPEPEEDILAQVQPPQQPPPKPAEPEPAKPAAWSGSGFFVNDMPLPFAAPAKETPEEEPPDDFEEEIPDGLLFADTTPDEPEEEPVAVDGLPIPTLWEELPCGLLVFDSLANLVFSNRPGLELLGHESLAELQEALENNLASFAAHGLNQKPLPDNQWPQTLAVKSRAPRGAVLSVLKRDGRRSWLRVDCRPHLADGNIARLSMTVVNLTGELPPLRTQETDQASPPPPPRKKDRAKQRGRKKG